MRHRIYGKKLSRTRNERAGLFKSLIQSLFTYGTITTSETKASAIKGMVDKIINLAKDKQVQSFFANKLLQERLIEEIVPKLHNRTSGYTSQVKIGVRSGDRTALVKMSLIGLENLKPLQKESKSQRVKESSEKAPVKEIKKPIAQTKGRKKINSRLSK